MTAVNWLIENLMINGLIRLTKEEHGLYKEITGLAKQMEKEYIEISDEEIEKAIIDQDIVKQEGYCHCFLEGAKWYREQLKKK